MDKSPDAFRTITEVSEWLDTPAHVLRFWESRFMQIKPVKRAGGRRYYRPVDMLLLGGIKKLLHDNGTTIKGVQKILREQGIKHVQSLSQPVNTVKSPHKLDTQEPTEPSPLSEPDISKTLSEPMDEDYYLLTQTHQQTLKPAEPVSENAPQTLNAQNIIQTESDQNSSTQNPKDVSGLSPENKTLVSSLYAELKMLRDRVTATLDTARN